MKKLTGAALVAALFCQPAFSAIEVTQSGNVKTIMFPSNVMGGTSTYYSVQTPSGSNRLPTAPASSLPVNQRAGGFGVTNVPSNSLRVVGYGDIPLTGSTRKIPGVEVSANVPSRNFAKALALAGKLAWPIGAIITAGEIFDYLKGYGISELENTGGEVRGKRIIPNETWTNTYGQSGFSSALASCQAAHPWATDIRATLIGNGSSALCSSAMAGGGLSTSTRTALQNQVVLVSQQEIEDMVAANTGGWPTSAARALSSALNVPGVSVQTEPLQVTGPASVPGEKVTSTETVKLVPGTNTEAAPGTTTSTDTGTKTTTRQESTAASYRNNTVTTNNTTTNTTVTITNNVTNQTTIEGDKIEEVENPAEPQEIETCGLPGKPACKIDESGTPVEMEDTAEQDAKTAIKPLDDFIANPNSVLPELPKINWAFTLPSGCAPIALPAFEPWLQQIDVCQFQPIFHDIMGFVWVMGGLFGAIGTFWRNTFSQG